MRVFSRGQQAARRHLSAMPTLSRASAARNPALRAMLRMLRPATRAAPWCVWPVRAQSSAPEAAPTAELANTSLLIIVASSTPMGVFTTSPFAWSNATVVDLDRFLDQPELIAKSDISCGVWFVAPTQLTASSAVAALTSYGTIGTALTVAMATLPFCKGRSAVKKQRITIVPTDQ